VFSARYTITQLMVMPTSGGKTATFVIPALCEAYAAVYVAREDYDAGGSGGAAAVDALAGLGRRVGWKAGVPAAWYPPVTIMLTPTRAIPSNAMETAKGAGLTFGDWPRGCGAGEASLFVVDIGTIFKHIAVFRDAVRRQSDSGRLARVEIEEVYLVLLWSPYSDARAHVPGVLADLPCPLLLMAATVPQGWLNVLLASVGPTSDLLRCFIGPASKRRENIRYLQEPVPYHVRYRRI